MHPRNFLFFSAPGRSFFIHQEPNHSTALLSRVSRAWNGPPGDVLVEPANVGLFKFRVNKLILT
nr:unnamed protein product [Callosobruchus chinensis]